MNAKQPGRRDTILLVEDDSEILEPLRQFLKELGYDVEVALDEHESWRLMGQGVASVQLILVNQRMTSDDALAAGRRIRTHVKVQTGAPVVVLPFEFSKELEGRNESVGQGDYKSYMTTEQQLGDLLAALLN